MCPSPPLNSKLTCPSTATSRPPGVGGGDHMAGSKLLPSDGFAAPMHSGADRALGSEGAGRRSRWPELVSAPPLQTP